MSLYFKRFSILISCLIIISFVASSCGLVQKAPDVRKKTYYTYFDTVSTVYSYKGDPQEEFDSNCSEVEEILKEYHALFDIYHEYSGINNLKTINLNAGKQPVKVDSKIIDFLLYCKEIYSLTFGETNIAMGSVLKLWQKERKIAEGAPENARLPDTDELSYASAHTDIDKIVINEEDSTVYISDPLVSIDVGAVGKGYAAQMAAVALRSRGVSSYVLNIGGNICAIGAKHDNSGWVTGITNPVEGSEDEFICRIRIKDTALVTSGDYERCYYVDGVKYHHIIDKDTNMPAEYFSSVSVLAPDSALADALSTALFCMSYEDGVELISNMEDVGVIWVYPNGEVKMTPGIIFVP